MSSIADSIRHLALRGCEMYLSICTVDSVDEDARTIDCTPIDEGAQLIGVNLQSDQNAEVGFVSFPAVGSDVVVGFINPAVAVVVLATEITKTVLTVSGTEITVKDKAIDIAAGKTTLKMDGKEVVWNGGSETTANATELQNQLNIMSKRITGIITAITDAAVGSQDGGLTYKTQMSAIVSSLKEEDFSNIIDNKIKH